MQLKLVKGFRSVWKMEKCLPICTLEQ